MATTKKITIISTRMDKPTMFESTAETLEDLKKEMTSRKINFSGMAIVEKKSRNTLELPDARLCDGDCIIFLTAKKVKSGAGKKKVEEPAKPVKKAPAKKAVKKEEPKKAKPAAKKAVTKPAAKPATKAAKVVVTKKEPKGKPAKEAPVNQDELLMKEAREIERFTSK